MPNERNPDEIGALWLRESKGRKYLSGKINGEPVVVFKNENKTNEKATDYRVLRSTRRDH